MCPWWMGDGDPADAGFGDLSSEARRSALVVLAGPGDPVLAGPGDPIRAWFAERGFAVVPTCADQLMISASKELFADIFGTADPGIVYPVPAMTDAAGVELSGRVAAIHPRRRRD